MRWALALTLLLGGCGGGLVTRDEATEIAEDQADASVQGVRTQISDLDAKVDALETRLDGAEAKAAGIDADLNGTRALISQNARAANRNAVKDMTRRGACGTEWVTLSTGGSVSRNKECTDKDLNP